MNKKMLNLKDLSYVLCITLVLGGNTISRIPNQSIAQECFGIVIL